MAERASIGVPFQQPAQVLAVGASTEERRARHASRSAIMLQRLALGPALDTPSRSPIHRAEHLGGMPTREASLVGIDWPRSMGP